MDLDGYRSMLRRIAQEQIRWAGTPQPPCDREQVEELSRRVSTELGAGLPAEYADFLLLHNGLDWNGVVFYAAGTVPIAGRRGDHIAGLVEMNLAWREDPRFGNLLVLGSDGLDLYAYRISTAGYEIRDEVPHNLIEGGLCFERLMTRALTRALS